MKQFISCIVAEERTEIKRGMKETQNDVSVEKDGSREARMDLDTILVEEIGQFGWYQRRALALCALVALMGGYSGNEYVFSAARISTRCLIPECEGPSAEWAPAWLAAAVPGAGAGSPENCARFNGSGTAPAPVDDGSCPAHLFDQGTVVACEAYVYENNDTIVYDFELACQEWQRALVGSVSTLGMALALPLTGMLADARGRRTALALAAASRAWLGLARYFTTTYAGFISFEFLEAVFGAAGFSCAYTIAMEFVGPKYRVAAGATTSTCFSLGMIMQASVAWALPYWRHFTLALYIPQLFMIVYFWIMPESVRWYMSKGRYKESETVLKQAARMNGKQLSEMSLQGLKQNSEEERRRDALKKVQKVREPWLVSLVFQYKTILLRCAVTPIWWITTTLVYYGLSMNAVNMSGNKYINYMMVAAVEIPGFWTAVVLLDRIGRKPLLFGAFWICSVCQIGFIFMPDGYFVLSLAVYLVGKYCISMVVTSIYIYTNELYPTRYRTSLFAFSSMIGRIGSITAPLTPALSSMVWEPLPFVLFAALAATSGLLVLLTPETRGAPLPDSMEQAAHLGRNQLLQPK